jgi:hypothetical protein
MSFDDDMLQRIARHLMLYGSFSNVGLLTGKTGIVIFFYHYARHTGKKLYDDFAGELIDEIYKEVHSSLSCDFKNGLCGIAWGIEYLIHNRFLEADADEVLEDLDKRIIEKGNWYNTNNSIETGVKGVACYVISRHANKININCRITKKYIDDLIKTLHEYNDEDNILLIKALENIENKKAIMYYNPLFSIVDKVTCNRKSLFVPSRPAGIDKNGYAGIGLRLMKIGRP